MDSNPVATPVPPGYDFVRPIGSGGMGEVVLARHRESGALAAIKFLSPARAIVSDTAGLRFDREARLMTGFDHPNVVRVLDRGQVGGRDYLVMEYIDGPSLRDRLTPGRPMPVKDVRQLLAGLATALGYLEAQGVVHRDLKPSNILLSADFADGADSKTGRQGGERGLPVLKSASSTKSADSPTVKVTDFGIAAATEDASLTTTGEVLGTYDYMAPEQRARLPVDARADQYAFAVIAYEMLTGRRPVGTFKPPSKLNPALSPGVDAAVGRALQEDPDDRYPDAAAFHADLDRALGERRPRWPGILGASVTAAAVAFAAWAFLLSPSRRQAGGETGDAVAVRLESALAHKKRGDFDKALVEIDAALALTPDHVGALTGRGSVLPNLKRYDEAIGALDDAIRRAPTAAEAFAWRGWSYSHRPNPDFDKARADYDEAVRLDPDLAVAYHFRGLFWRGRNDWTKARDDFAQAVRIEPGHLLAHGMLAQIYASTTRPEVRDPKKAVEHGRTACELSHWADWRQLRALAYAYAADRQYAEAAAMCEKALPLIRDDKQEQDVRKQLDGYRKRLSPGSKEGQP